MDLTLLAKDENSGQNGCPGVHLDATGGDFVITGHPVDSTLVENVLPGEAVIRINPDIVLAAVAQYQARRP